MGGVPDEVSEEQIVEHFNRWGNVVDVYFPGKKGAKRVRPAHMRRLAGLLHAGVLRCTACPHYVGLAAWPPHMLMFRP